MPPTALTWRCGCHAAPGGRVDPFWALYSQHKTKDVKKILAGLRIGTLDAKSARYEFGFCTASMLCVRACLTVACGSGTRKQPSMRTIRMLTNPGRVTLP